MTDRTGSCKRTSVKRITTVCFNLLAGMFLLAACRPDILRYGNRPTCLGFLDFEGTRDLPALVPASAIGINLLWNRGNHFFVLSDNNGVVHLIDKAGAVVVDQLNRMSLKRSAPLSVAEEHDLLAVSLRPGRAATTYVYSLEETTVVDPIVVMPGFQSPQWHPHELLLAGIVYPDGEHYEHGSNVIGVFGLQGAEPTLAASYELAYSYIEEVFGWSSTGQVIAVSQHGQNGLTPQYVFPSKGSPVQHSLFSTANHSCVRDGQWAPEGDVIAFSGVNETMEGWDIFLETVTASESGAAGSLVNLTNSPREDEREAAWSPGGERIAYTKAYEDEGDSLRQELFVVKLDDLSSSPFQLTNTLDEFESNPIWLSQSEIAYLSWRPGEGSWFLNILSTSEGGTASRRVMEIPSSWYWSSLSDDER